MNNAIPHALFSFLPRKSELNVLNQEVPDSELQAHKGRTQGRAKLSWSSNGS